MDYFDQFHSRLLIWESNYGRDYGWYVEIDDQKIAELVDPEYVEMFWDAYRIVPIDCPLANSCDFHSPEFWDGFDEMTFRSKKFGVVVSAFPAATPLSPGGRVLMRGLYLPIRGPGIVERAVMWFRRRFLKKTG
ncbi:hypothetical protein GC197_02370 [bacterium]|nr:hypothetical protein [bacterium]